MRSILEISMLIWYIARRKAHQNSNKTDTDSSLECYDHLHVYDKRETMLSENLHSSNVGFRSNTDPTYDVSTMGTTQRKDANSMYDHAMESMDSTCSNIEYVYAVSSKVKS
jgi:hypothetical protein